MKRIEKIQYITSGSTPEDILGQVNGFVDSGGKWVQLRIKNDEVDFFELGKRVKAICQNRAVFIVNDKVEIAKELDADGVHLGLDDMPIQEARTILGAAKIIGGTANTLEDCLNREKDGADYIGLGPFRTTTTKKKLSPILGLNGYQEIVPVDNPPINIPVVAIGGIVEEDVPELIQNSAVYGVAVSGLINKTKEKTRLIKSLSTILKDTAFNYNLSSI